MVLISNMTMLFSNSSSKIPKSGIFGPKFKDFQLCIKFCNKINSRTLISNITIFFSNSRPKIPKEDIFGPKFRDFYFFMKFCNQTNQRVLTSNVAIAFLKFQSNKTNSRISNMTIVFSNYSPKIRKLGIFVPRFQDCYFAANFVIKQI